MLDLEEVIVNGRKTHEIIGLCQTYSIDEIDRLSLDKIDETEIFDYVEKEKDIDEMIKDNSTSRRLVKVYQPQIDKPEKCISLIQILINRNINYLICYLRSSDINKYTSDLTFLAKMAKKIKNCKLIVFRGSTHEYVED
jgi:hypothetical protein